MYLKASNASYWFFLFIDHYKHHYNYRYNIITFKDRWLKLFRDLDNKEC